MSNAIEITYKWFYIDADDQEQPVNRDKGQEIAQYNLEIADEEYDTEEEAVYALNRYFDMKDWSTRDDDYVLKKIYNKKKSY